MLRGFVLDVGVFGVGVAALGVGVVAVCVVAVWVDVECRGVVRRGVWLRARETVDVVLCERERGDERLLTISLMPVATIMPGDMAVAVGVWVSCVRVCVRVCSCVCLRS
mmetsp:Transcript_35478/g.52113  ORF Transcript_35478/g.52113 Transcript_35478/m.52113 type:complete len:109 (-) Transcript_35478:199-525(-)